MINFIHKQSFDSMGLQGLCLFVWVFMTQTCQLELEFINWFLGLAQHTLERVFFFIIQSLESTEEEYILPILCCICLLMRWDVFCLLERRYGGLQETKSQVYFLLLCKKADSVIWNVFLLLLGKGLGGGIYRFPAVNSFLNYLFNYFSRCQSETQLARP
jgi:hypothetical protein